MANRGARVAPDGGPIGGAKPIRSTSCTPIVAGRRARSRPQAGRHVRRLRPLSATSGRRPGARTGSTTTARATCRGWRCGSAAQRPLLLSSAVARRQRARRRRPDQRGRRSGRRGDRSRAARCTSRAAMLLQDGALHERLHDSQLRPRPGDDDREPRVRRRLRRPLRGARHAAHAARRTLCRRRSTTTRSCSATADSTAQTRRTRVSLRARPRTTLVATRRRASMSRSRRRAEHSFADQRRLRADDERPRPIGLVLERAERARPDALASASRRALRDRDVEPAVQRLDPAQRWPIWR